MSTLAITYRIRIVLPDGSLTQRTSIGTDTFGKIREFLWVRQQNSFETERDLARFRLATAPLYFQDDDTIEDLVRLYHVFEDLGKPPLERYTICLEAPQDYGDQRCRQASKPDPKKPFIWHGYLTKCSKRTGKGYWHRRYFVYQGQTLYWYQTVEAFQKGQKAEKWLAMGGVMARLDHEVVRSTSKENVFVLDVPQHVSTERGKDLYVLQAETPQGLRTFVGLVLQHTWNIKVATVMNILPHLRKEVEVEGIFRLAGDKNKIERIESEIDLGKMPDFAKYGEDEIHNKTTLLKRGLRFMEPPLIPTESYENYIRIGRCTDIEQRAQQLKTNILALPLKHLYIITKLFNYLTYCTKFEQSSKMNASNLAIVIGPNILRTNIANPLKAMDDSDYIRLAVTTMITHSSQIFPTDQYLSEKDKEINYASYYHGLTTAEQPTHQKEESEIGLFKVAVAVVRQSRQFDGPLLPVDSNSNSNIKRSSSPAPVTSTSQPTPKQFGGLFGFSMGIPPPPPMSSSSSDNSSSTETRKSMPTPPKLGGSSGSNHSSATPKISAVASPTMMGMAGFDPSKVKLRKTNAEDPVKGKKENPPSTNQLDFRGNLKKTTKTEPEKKLTTGTTHLVDFRSRLKSVSSPANQPNSSDNSTVNSLPKLDEQDYSPGTQENALPKLDRDNSPEAEPTNSSLPKLNLGDSDIPGEAYIEEDLTVDHYREPGSVFEEEEEKKFDDRFLNPVISEHSEKVILACEHFRDEIAKLQDAVDSLTNDSERLVDQVSEIARAGEIEKAQEISSKFDEVQKEVIESTKLQMEAFRTLNKYLADIVANHETKLLVHNSGGTPGGPNQSSFSPSPSPMPDLKIATASFDYSGGYRPDELTFKKHTILIVTNDPNDGWLFGHVQGYETNRGWFPANYVVIE